MDQFLLAVKCTHPARRTVTCLRTASRLSTSCADGFEFLIANVVNNSIVRKHGPTAKKKLKTVISARVSMVEVNYSILTSKTLSPFARVRTPYD